MHIYTARMRFVESNICSQRGRENRISLRQETEWEIFLKLGILVPFQPSDVQIVPHPLPLLLPKHKSRRPRQSAIAILPRLVFLVWQGSPRFSGSTKDTDSGRDRVNGPAPLPLPPSPFPSPALESELRATVWKFSMRIGYLHRMNYMPVLIHKKLPQIMNE